LPRPRPAPPAAKRRLRFSPLASGVEAIDLVRVGEVLGRQISDPRRAGAQHRPSPGVVEASARRFAHRARGKLRPPLSAFGIRDSETASGWRAAGATPSRPRGSLQLHLAVARTTNPVGLMSTSLSPVLTCPWISVSPSLSRARSQPISTVSTPLSTFLTQLRQIRCWPSASASLPLGEY